MSQLSRDLVQRYPVTYWHPASYDHATGAFTFDAPVVIRAGWRNTSKMVFMPDGSAATNTVEVTTEMQAWRDGETVLASPLVNAWVAFGEFTDANPASVNDAIRVLAMTIRPDTLDADTDPVTDFILVAGK